MASAVIHMCVANEINKKLKRDSSRLLIGTIAPDISKHVGENKKKSHFLDEVQSDIPNLQKFLNKYKNNLNDDFVLGYYIHLYTDYLWFKYFVTELLKDNVIQKLDGSKIKCHGEMLWKYIYNDYTNLNEQLLDEYDLDCKIFYNEIPELKKIIDEIPMDKIELIVNKASIILANSKVKKDMVFNLDNVKKFISTSTELILANLEELNVI